jgi:hypothetical protein
MAYNIRGPDLQFCQKLSLVWSSKQKRNVPVRIFYKKERREECDVYTIRRVEELD